MPYTVKSFQATPNPNALKCVLDRPITRTPVSFRSAAEAPGLVGSGGSGAGDGEEGGAGGGEATDAHRLAAALFGVPGVAGLLFNHDWITVNKTPQSSWGSVKAGVSRVLGDG